MPSHQQPPHDPMVIHLKSPGASREQKIAPTPVQPTVPPYVAAHKARSPRKRYPRTVILGIVVLLLVGVSVAYVLQSRTTISEPTPAKDSTPMQPVPSEVTAIDADDTVAKVGRHILLPSGEIPTIAAVSDLEALKGQEFFRNAQVGDVVLMFGKSRRAILYSPTQDKIIEVAPITTDMQKP